MSELLAKHFWHPNVYAFSRAVRGGESRQDDRAYHMRYGGYFDGKFAPPEYFEDLSQHPRIFAPTKDGRRSSAAGAYQATHTTWSEEQARWKWPDFSRQSQDEFFVARLITRGALDEVTAGKFHEACALCKTEWTSLPGGSEENAATSKALKTYLEYGGALEAPPEADPLKTEHYGEAVTESTIMPIPSAEEQEKNMAPIVAAVLPGLIKAAPDLIRLFGKSEMSERNAAIAERVVDTAVVVTNAINAQEAAEKIASSPAATQAFRAAVAENFNQWMGMMVKFREMDEASRAKARDFVTAYGRAPVAGKFTFVELLSLVFVIVAAVGGGFVLWDPLEKFTTEMQTAVVMLMLIGGWNGVKEFWLGSSMGSMRKDDRAITQEAKQ